MNWIIPMHRGEDGVYELDPTEPIWRQLSEIPLPPGHPNCRCVLEGFSEKIDNLFLTGVVKGVVKG